MREMSTTGDVNSMPVYCQKHMNMARRDKKFAEHLLSSHHSRSALKSKSHQSSDNSETSNSNQSNDDSICQNEYSSSEESNKPMKRSHYDYDNYSSEESVAPRKRRHSGDYYSKPERELKNIRLDKSMRSTKNYMVPTSVLRKLPYELQIMIPHHSSFSFYKVKTTIQKVIKK
jgi:hypothetical protein